MSVIDDELKLEGGYSNNPVDKGGRTNYGISEKANPEAWADGKVTEQEARDIFQKRYVDNPGFNQIKDQYLFRQLVDFGITSGPAIAIQKLQGILAVTVDGILGPETLAALATIHPEDINNALVAARVKMIGKLISKNHSQAQFAAGWLDRAVSFLV